MSVVLQDRERAQMETRIKALEEDAAKRRCAPHIHSRSLLESEGACGMHVGFPSMPILELQASACHLSSCCSLCHGSFFANLGSEMAGCCVC